jgi:hypothetical protein
MAYPYVKVGPWTNGAAPALSAANMTLIDDGIYDPQFPPSVRVTHSVAQSIASGAFATLAFDTETFDSHGMHDTG